MTKTIVFSFFLILSSTVLFGQHISKAYSHATLNDPDIRATHKTSDNGYIVGFDIQWSPDSLHMPCAGIMKLNASGDVVWCDTLEIPNSSASCSFQVTENSVGEYLLFGLTYNDTAASYFGFLTQFDDAGSVLSYSEYPTGNSSIPGFSVNTMYLLPNDKLLLLMCLFDQAILINTNSDGTINWGVSSTIDTLGNGKNPGYDAIPLSNGDAMCSNKRGDALNLARFDSNGNLIWSVDQYIGTYTQIKSLTETPSGKIYGSGFCTEPSLGPNGLPLLLEIDPTDGNILWIKTLSDTTELFYASNSQLIDDEDGLIMMYSLSQSFFGGVSEQKSRIVKFDYNGNILSASELSGNYETMDYMVMAKNSGNEYTYAGKIADDIDTLSIIQTVDDLLGSNCIRTESSLFVTDYTNFGTIVNPAFMSAYSEHIQPSITTAPIILTVSNVCSDIGIVENNVQSLFYDRSNFGINYSFQAGDNYSNYSIFDLQGRVTQSGSVLDGNGLIPVKNLQNGIYIISFFGTSGKQSLKFEIAY